MKFPRCYPLQRSPENINEADNLVSSLNRVNGVLLGPSQSGKTHLLKNLSKQIPHAQYLSMECLTSLDVSSLPPQSTLLLDDLDQLRVHCMTTSLEGVMDKLNKIKDVRFCISCRDTYWRAEDLQLLTQLSTREISVWMMAPLSDEEIDYALADKMAWSHRQIRVFREDIKSLGWTELLKCRQFLLWLARRYIHDDFCVRSEVLSDLCLEHLSYPTDQVSEHHGKDPQRRLALASKLSAYLYFMMMRGLSNSSFKTHPDYLDTSQLVLSDQEKEMLYPVLLSPLFQHGGDPQQDLWVLRDLFKTHLTDLFLSKLVDVGKIKTWLSWLSPPHEYMSRESAELLARLMTRFRDAESYYQITCWIHFPIIVDGLKRAWTDEEKNLCLETFFIATTHYDKFVQHLLCFYPVENIRTLFQKIAHPQQGYHRQKQSLIEHIIRGLWLRRARSSQCYDALKEIWENSVMGGCYRMLAVKAARSHCPEGESHGSLVASLLQKTFQGEISDPEDAFLAALLEFSYEDLSPEKWLSYLKVPYQDTDPAWPYNRDKPSDYEAFWFDKAPRSWLKQQGTLWLLKLIDTLASEGNEIKWHKELRLTGHDRSLWQPKLRPSKFGDVLILKWIALALKRDDVDSYMSPERLIGWIIRLSGSTFWHQESHTLFFRQWISHRPTLIKQFLYGWIFHRLSDGEDPTRFHPLFETGAFLFITDGWPEDLGIGCLNKAIELAEQPEQPKDALHRAWQTKLLEVAVTCINMGISVKSLSPQKGSERLKDFPSIAKEFQSILSKSTPQKSVDGNPVISNFEQRESQRLSWLSRIEQHREELLSHLGPWHILTDIAKLYFTLGAYKSHQEARKRFAGYFGDRMDLLEAALEGLSQCLFRNDMESPDERLLLLKKQRYYPSGWAILAGCEEYFKQDGSHNFKNKALSAKNSEHILSAYFTTPVYCDQGRYKPSWLSYFARKWVDVYGKTLLKHLEVELMLGKSIHFYLHDLCHNSHYQKIAQQIWWSLLESFPRSCQEKQQPSLQMLLLLGYRLVYQGEDKQKKKEFGRILVQRSQDPKVDEAQKICWLTMDFLISNGCGFSSSGAAVPPKTLFRSRLESHIEESDKFRELRRDQMIVFLIDAVRDDRLFKEGKGPMGQMLGELHFDGLRQLFTLMAKVAKPPVFGGGERLTFYSQAARASDLCNQLLCLMRNRAGHLNELTIALEELMDIPDLKPWHHTLAEGLELQKHRALMKQPKGDLAKLKSLFA